MSLSLQQGATCHSRGTVLICLSTVEHNLNAMYTQGKAERVTGRGFGARPPPSSLPSERASLWLSLVLCHWRGSCR